MSTEAKNVLTEADSLADLHGLQRPVAVADELEQLRAFKAEVESQKPVAVMYRTGGALTNAECADDDIFDICCRAETPLYAKPVPADKPARITEQDAQSIISHRRQNRFRPDGEWLPRLLAELNADREQVPAVAVPDGWKLVPIEPTTQQIYAAETPIDAVVSCRQSSQHAIAEGAYRSMLEAAPSHSQQSVDVPESRNIIKVKRVSDQSVQVTFASCRTAAVFERFIIAASPNCCPSHESEQGGE